MSLTDTHWAKKKPQKIVLPFTGCPAEDIGVPFDSKEFNLTDYLTTARENFIGRQWLYQEIERVFHPTRAVSGVLIIGDPGAGKSALSAQLVCSRTSSRTIHDHVLGYHLCKHSDKNTQIAGKFVRNLAEMIARRLPEYGYIVSNSSHIQRSLNADCVTIQDPVGCFEQAILLPLKSLTNVPKDNWYIVIDALDECLTQSETSHSIVYLLNNKLPRFPSWLKLVLTSRNESSVSLHSDKIKKLVIDPEDPRNIDDIELFLSTKFYQDGPFLHRVKFWFGDSGIENTAKLISVLLSKSQGNFLFVKEMLHHWETSRVTRSDPYALPETLGELYYSYFQRLYDQRVKFKPVRQVLELIVSTFQPLTPKEIFEVLRMKETNLEEDYDFKDRIQELGHFLRYGENDTVTLYHLSLTEWLTSDSDRNGQFYVSKKKGHEVFCDFYFKVIFDGGKSALSRHVLTLAQHIAHGGWKQAYVKEFLRFPSQVVNTSDPESNRTLLHLAATINSTDVLELLLRHFSCIDCSDTRGITPAFLAAEHGLVGNLALMVRRGAEVNRKTKSLTSSEKFKEKHTSYDVSNPVLESKSKFWGSTMLHAAAHAGHLEVITFLLDNGAFISTANDVHLTALQIAAENGHLRVVKALYEAGAVADQTALHHAAANNRLEVVKYLLKIGVKDKCMRCDGSFYWLKKEKHRLQSQAVVSSMKIPIKKHCQFDDETLKIQALKDDSCYEHGNISTTLNVVGELFDDMHQIFCETALHSAISLGHKAIVEELVGVHKSTIACRDYTGRTPLHEAVRQNNTEIVKLLLMEDQTKAHSTCDQWQNVEGKDEMRKYWTLSHEESFEYHRDICHCGYTPLHLAARYGHYEIAIELVKRGRANVGARDCFGATPLHVAACHNHREMVSLFLELGADMGINAFNGSTQLHSAAACGAVEVIDHLLYHGANLRAVDDFGFTALHYAILNTNSSNLERNILLKTEASSGEQCQLVMFDRTGHLARFFAEKNRIKNTDHYRWLDTLIHLIVRGSAIDAVDMYGQTALHIAARNGLADAVNVLLQKKAKLEMYDKSGKTPLEVAVENGIIVAKQRRKESTFILGESLDGLREALRDHEMVVYLLLSYGASIKKCNRNRQTLLHYAVTNSQPYIAQLLLLRDASLTCKDNFRRTPLIAYLHNGGYLMDVVLQHFNASVTIKCGKPFNLSVFHLLCYRPPSIANLNFFERRECDDHKCRSLKSSFNTAIERHRLKYKVIDSCLDAEGFTPLHRAAQGANIVAVRNLIEHGADVSLLSPQGHDALTLAILHAGGNIWLNLEGFKETSTDNVSDAAIELLRHNMKTHGFQIVCDSSRAELTLYHLAASRGLVKFIKEIFKDKNLHQLDVDCPNREGITPMYLAKIFDSLVGSDTSKAWAEVVQFIESQGGQMQYPSRDAEYNVIYKRLYGWIPEDLKVKLRPDIRGFVVGLLSTYGYWQTNSMHCNLDSMNETVMEFGSPTGSLIFGKELERQLALLNRKPILSYIAAWALQDIKMCLIKQKRGLFLHFAYNRYIRVLPRKAQKINVERLHKRLFYLMRMWYGNVFGDFACLKMVFDTYRPLFVSEEKLKELIEQYEGSPPLWYLNQICFAFEQAFQFHLLHYSEDTNYTTFGFLYHGYPNLFLRERMGWTTGHLPGYSSSWPLDFLIKFSLGFYSQYDYLKALNVGLEPKTHTSLYSDKMRQVLLRARKKGELKRKGRKLDKT